MGGSVVGGGLVNGDAALEASVELQTGFHDGHIFIPSCSSRDLTGSDIESQGHRLHNVHERVPQRGRN